MYGMSADGDVDVREAEFSTDPTDMNLEYFSFHLCLKYRENDSKIGRVSETTFFDKING